MFSALLDQIQSNPVLQNYAESHWELRWKVVSEGYETLLKTGVLSWPDDPMTGSMKEWRSKMLIPTEYRDEVVLNLVANLLEVDICIIPAFRESSIHQSLGVTIIKCMKDTVHKPLFLAAFSESDFISPHYQSVFPRTESNDLIRRCSLPVQVFIEDDK